MIDLNKIKPKIKGISDKYSWNLYKFLNSLFSDKEFGKYYKNQLNICWLTSSRLDGKHLEFNSDNLLMHQILIVPLGLENDRSFYSLSSILNTGKAERFAMPWNKDKLIDITDWFFDAYTRDGRCVFDRNHNGWLLGDKDRFTYINNTRKCNWCGKWQQKEIHKITKIERKEVWI